MNGPFGNRFPYTNFHEINLDWMIQIAKDFLDQYTSIQDIIENGTTTLENTTETGVETLEGKTETGIETLDDKAETLEGLLQQWYDTHSGDIASELAQAILEFANEADEKAAAALASIPADYSDLTLLVNKIKELAIYTSNVINTTDLFLVDGFTTGVLTSSGTVNSSETTCQTSDFIPVTPTVPYYIQYPSLASGQTYSVWRCTYDENKTLIQYTTYTIDSKNRLFVVPDGVYYVRFSFGNTIVNNGIYFRSVYNFIDTINKRYLDQTYTDEVLNNKNLIGDSAIHFYEILRNNGTTTFDANMVTTDYIELTPYTYYLFTLVNFDLTFRWLRCTYDENKNFIDYTVNDQTTKTWRYKCPANVKYIKLSVSFASYNKGLGIFPENNMISVINQKTNSTYQNYKYNGSSIVLKEDNTYDITPLFAHVDIIVPADESIQAIAIYDNTLFQFIGDGKVRAYDMTTDGTQLSEFLGTFGHGNSACFSRTFADDSDRFPLIYVSDFNGYVYIHRITTTSTTLTKTLYFNPATYGYYPQLCINNNNSHAYILGNKINQEQMLACKITEVDLTDMVENEDHTFTPATVDTFEVAFDSSDPAILQGVKYNNGNIFLVSGGFSTSYYSRIYVINTTSKSIVSTIRDFPEEIKIHELEDCEIWFDQISEKNVMIIVIPGYGYYKMIF